MVSNVIAELCICIITWNVASKYPDGISLTNLLELNGTSSCPQQQLPDIYVISLQEINTKPKNQVLSIFQDNPWVIDVNSHLQEHGYVKVDTKQLQGLLIMMFSQHRHIEHMEDIETESTRTGLGGLWGNKGAVSIRMSLYGMGVTFVGAHLAAHDHELKERIVDYNQIVNNHQYKQSNYRTIFDHDFVFWFGDLNFRLTGDDSAWDVRTMVEQNRTAELIQYDQLLLVRQTGNAFALLNENLPTFPPTFKFIEGTSDYNTKRRPAWCDRILYRVEENKYHNLKPSIQQLSYKSHPEYLISDHKPVSAEFLYVIESLGEDKVEMDELTYNSGARSLF